MIRAFSKFLERPQSNVRRCTQKRQWRSRRSLWLKNCFDTSEEKKGHMSSTSKHHTPNSIQRIYPSETPFNRIHLGHTLCMWGTRRECYPTCPTAMSFYIFARSKMSNQILPTAVFVAVADKHWSAVCSRLHRACTDSERSTRTNRWNKSIYISIWDS